MQTYKSCRKSLLLSLLGTSQPAGSSNVTSSTSNSSSSSASKLLSMKEAPDRHLQHHKQQQDNSNGKDTASVLHRDDGQSVVLKLEAEPPPAQATRSIYDLWSPRQCRTTLAVVSISQFLNPFASSIMVPSLKDLEAHFHADATAGAAVLALFYFPLGISSLAWGPACDVWGRKSIYLASTAMFAAASFGCIFAQNMAMLLAFRALQGVALGAYRGAGTGTIADIFPGRKRGLAFGILLLSTLVGPVLGPLLGGFLGEAYGWQAPFIALLVFAAGVILPATALLVKETLQYKIIASLSPAEAATIKEAPSILANPPRFGSVWAPLVAVCDKQVVLHLLQATVGFACMLSAQIELPGQLTAPPYSMGPGHIGAAMIAAGGAGMIASPVGGKLFDRAAAKSGQPMLRLTGNSLVSLIGMPVGLLLYGWSAQYRAHLGLLLTGLFLTGFSMCIYIPAFMGYLSIVKQKEAGSASSGHNAIMFVVTGTLVLAGAAITRALGIGWFMTVAAVVHVIFAAAALWQIVVVKRRQREMLCAVPASPNVH